VFDAYKQNLKKFLPAVTYKAKAENIKNENKVKDVKN